MICFTLYIYLCSCKQAYTPNRFLAMQLILDFPINPRFTFDNFVVCGGNSTAWRFARMLIEKPETNLLYVFGLSGAGKTHLLQAIGHHFYDALEIKGEGIAYVSFKEAALLYGDHVVPEQESALGKKFSGAPVLLIDDVDLLPPNPYLRTELWQIFNEFHGAGKKIVITGKRPPKELSNLDDHLISRLLWGLVAEIDVSDDPSRRLIMKKLAEDRQILLPDEAIEVILSQTRREVPALAEALERVHHYALATGRKISPRLTRDALLEG
jgi:chromosomal replication initiator protein